MALSGKYAVIEFSDGPAKPDAKTLSTRRKSTRTSRTTSSYIYFLHPQRKFFEWLKRFTCQSPHENSIVENNDHVPSLETANTLVRRLTLNSSASKKRHSTSTPCLSSFRTKRTAAVETVTMCTASYLVPRFPSHVYNNRGQHSNTITIRF